MVGADVGFILAIIPSVDPFYIRLGRLLSTGVPAVLHLRSRTEIRHPIVCGFPVSVVDSLWQPTLMKQPDEPVLHVVLLGYTNSDITPFVRRASPLTGIPPIPHHISRILGKRLLGSGLPIQVASLISKEAPEFIFAYQTLG